MRPAILTFPDAAATRRRRRLAVGAGTGQAIFVAPYATMTHVVALGAWTRLDAFDTWHTSSLHDRRRLAGRLLAVTPPVGWTTPALPGSVLIAAHTLVGVDRRACLGDGPDEPNDWAPRPVFRGLPACAPPARSDARSRTGTAPPVPHPCRTSHMRRARHMCGVSTQAVGTSQYKGDAQCSHRDIWLVHFTYRCRAV